KWPNRYALLPKRKICVKCFVDLTCPYTKQLISQFDNPCGGTDIYLVKLRKEEKEEEDKKKETKQQQTMKCLRLHNIVHHEEMLDSPHNRSPTEYQPITGWGEVWKVCQEWVNA